MPLHDENQCSLTHGVDNHAAPEGSPRSQTLVSAEKHRGKRPHNCVGKHSKTQRVFTVTPQMASCFTLPRHTYDDESNNSSPSKVCGMSMPHFQKEVRRQLDENPYHEEEEKKSQRPQKSDLGQDLHPAVLSAEAEARQVGSNRHRPADLMRYGARSQRPTHGTNEEQFAIAHEESECLAKKRLGYDVKGQRGQQPDPARSEDLVAE